VLILKETNFIQTPFDNEEELENVVIENHEYIFGPNSFYLRKEGRTKVRATTGAYVLNDP